MLSAIMPSVIILNIFDLSVMASLAQLTIIKFCY
jgi:hypothetical protein